MGDSFQVGFVVGGRALGGTAQEVVCKFNSVCDGVGDRGRRGYTVKKEERERKRVAGEVRMFDALVKISKAYMTTEQLKKKAERMYGVSYVEALEMSYDNIQGDAAVAIRGMRRPRMPERKEKKDPGIGVSGGLPETSGGIGT